VRVTEKGRRLLAGESMPTLLVPAKSGRGAASAVDHDSWDGVDHGLFDALRLLRREEAIAREVPAYIVFGDTTLRDMARRRPSTVARLLDVHGVGQQEAANFGQQFVECIVGYCSQQGLERDVQPAAVMPNRPAATAIPPAAAVKAFPLFDEALSVSEVAKRLGRAVSTTQGYLDAYLRHRKVIDPVPWVPQREFEQIAGAVRETGAERLKAIHEALDGRISYEHIRAAIICLENRAAASENGANT
jgi:ATP-dependent DNA helicase RecQ